ncbi:MAG: metallophosphoesterase family protein [Chloroflexota bacterium]
MRPFRFVHAADLHIDSPFRGLMSLNPDVGERLKEATHEAFHNLVRLCIEERADFLVIAGDVFDGADRGVRAQLRFRDGLEELASHGIPAFVAHGNHDPLDGWSSAITWPEGTHIFGRDPESVIVRGRDGEPLAEAQGVSYPTREVHENLALRFSPPSRAGLFSIGVLHCNVGGDSNHPNYAPCSVQDLADVGLDYWALGHIHARRTLRERSPMIVYPGNIQGRDPGEPGERGCMVVDVSADGVPHAAFRPLDVVRWESREVSIEGLDGIDALYARMNDAVDSLREEAGGRDVVCRLTLTGRGPVHADLARGSGLAELQEELQERGLGPSPWVWVERLSDHTRPEMDLEARARQDDFLGAVLSRGAETTPEDVRPLLEEVFSGRRGRPEMPDDGQLREWIEEARWELAEVLEPEE